MVPCKSIEAKVVPQIDGAEVVALVLVPLVPDAPSNSMTSSWATEPAPVVVDPEPPEVPELPLLPPFFFFAAKAVPADELEGPNTRKLRVPLLVVEVAELAVPAPAAPRSRANIAVPSPLGVTVAVTSGIAQATGALPELSA
jgi:hypothetical protein